MSGIESVYQQIVDMAQRHGARRVILFGSRARGDALRNSDIDIAVEGCADFAGLEQDIQENLWSLLEVDVVNMDGSVSHALLDDIRRDGRVLYEKI